MAGIDQSTLWKFASMVLGKDGKATTAREQATFLRVDQDGTQWVRLPGSNDETPVNGRSLASAKPGDMVEWSVDDGVLSITGNATSPAVGERKVVETVAPVAEKAESASAAARLAQAAAESVEGIAASARAVADAAQAVAEAVNQHFFADTNGIHVTEATQEDWDANHTGANVLINSIGQLFRDGLNNLLTLTTENGARALTIWDGLGNAASNIVARFGSTIQFGSDTDPLMHIAAGIITMYPGDDYEAINFASDGTANVHYNVITGNVGIHSPQTITMTPANGSNGFSTAAGTVLWSSGGWAMAANQTANLAYKVSTCPTGIVLHWQPYTSSTVRNYYHHWQFVPKKQVASYAGTAVDVTLSSSKFASIATKTLYVSDNRVTGHADNAATGTANGITYTNNQWVLTQIIAV